MSETKTILERALQEPVETDWAVNEFVATTSPTTVNAISSVLNYIITDAFDLNIEESLWVSYHMNNILSPLNSMIPSALLGAVKQEMNTREYSQRLFKRSAEERKTVTVESQVRYAPVEDWVESLSEIVLSSYPNLRPMIKSSIIGALHGLLTELGVTSNPRKSRGSLYLPNAVRHLISKRK